MSRPEDDPTFDPNCDQFNPRRIKYDDVLAATRNCTGNVVRTPVIKSNLSEKLGIEIYLKLESMQLSGSFKYRGVIATLMSLTEEQKRYGVVTATNGNHGIALAMASAKLNIPCIIYFPVGTPAFRINKCQENCAKCVVYGENIIETKNMAIVFAKDKRMNYINGFDHPKMCEGEGSCGIEIIEQVPQVDAVIIPVGGGGLITGIGTAIKYLKPDTEIYGVETDKTCSMTESLRKNERIMLPFYDTMVDTLRVNMVGANTFHSCKTLIDKMVVVKEDWVPRAILHLAEDDKVVVEPGGACPMAACLAGLFPNLRGKTVVCVCSGGNICPSFMIRSIELGLSSEGRLVKFAVTVYDLPGAIAALCTLMSDIGIIIRDLIPERLQMEGMINNLKLTVIAETRGWDHVRELVDVVKKNYKNHYFPENVERAGKSDPCTRRGPCLAPNPKELLDPNCDPGNPRRIKFDDVKTAIRNLSEVVLRTPMIKSKLSEQLGMELYLKLESLQHTGSFKIRGVSNVLMSLDENQRKGGIVTSSTGNHAIATAYACQVYQIPCIIFVPTGTPPNKVIKCQTYGAKVVVVGPNCSESMKVAMTVAKDKNMTYINGYDHPKMLEGNGTIGSDIIDQYPSVDAVLIPVGGGGLIAGVGVALKGLKPEVEVYGIESDKTCSMTESLKKNERVQYEALDTMCENLRINVVGVNAFQTCKAVVDKMIVVTEDWIPRAITKLFEEDKIIVEAGGILPIAACIAGLMPYLKGKRVVCIMAGGNLNGQYFSRSLELGMAAEGRLLKFKVTVKDKTSSIAELFNLLLSIGVSIRDCVPERAWVQGDVFSVEYTIIAETKGWDNLKELVSLIKRYYRYYEFQEFPKENMKHEPTVRRGPCLAPQPVCMQK